MTNDESLGLGTAIGWIFALGGVALLTWGWLYDATIPSAADLYGLSDRTLNLGLIVTKLSLLITGGALLASGCGLLGRTTAKAPSPPIA